MALTLITGNTTNVARLTEEIDDGLHESGLLLLEAHGYARHLLTLKNLLREAYESGGEDPRDSVREGLTDLLGPTPLVQLLLGFLDQVVHPWIPEAGDWDELVRTADQHAALEMCPPFVVEGMPTVAEAVGVLRRLDALDAAIYVAWPDAAVPAPFAGGGNVLDADHIFELRQQANR